MNFSHHAYGIFGEDAGLRADEILKEFARTKNMPAEMLSAANPDFHRMKFERLAVDDSRSLRGIHDTMPFSAQVPRIFVIELHEATREAQNALLKILEEPRPDNYFFIVAPSAEVFLPTVLSRLEVISPDDTNRNSLSRTKKPKSSDKTGAADFLKMPLAEKIAFVDELAAQISDEKAEKHEAVAFLNSLEKELYASAAVSVSGSAVRVLPAAKFEAIARARDYVNDRAPSVKMLLEYVALSL